MDSRLSESNRFVRRIHGLRMVGAGLGFFCVASVFRENGAHALSWALLLVNALVWPHFAYFLALRSADPQRAEFRNLAIDSAFAGAWIALMHFNVVPSALLVTMLTIDKISVGGWRLVARTAALQFLACALTAAALDFQFEPRSSMVEILACLPFMFAYSAAISTATYALSNKVRQQNKLLAELSRIDGLTGLFNHNHWEQMVAVEVRRHRRSGRSAVLMMIDVDNFKSTNDRHGHPIGDGVLRNVAASIRNSVRDIDTAGRYGGDEFGVVLPEIHLQDAAKIAERIRQGVELQPTVGSDRLHCTVSIGMSEIGPEIEDARAWIAQADAMLYRAKAAGRNRITSALELPSTHSTQGSAIL
ncbi:MAG: hypothetical protein JWR16_2200 [Nevskia sp.]|nr:hypothetical protein [Nevskia sp.]